ncbi:SGNH/GDSL hydrolase family protein [bacterium]|nr:SGNH/GDSL hydrolase family protein [bacterium]
MSNSHPPARRSPWIYFLIAFAVAFVPPAILLLPLLFHDSGDTAIIGSYALCYAHGVEWSGLGLLVFCTSISLLCWRKRTLKPAFAVVVLSACAVAGFLSLEVFLHFSQSDQFSYYKKWGQKRSLFLAYEARPNHAWEIEGGSYSTDRHGFRTNVSEPNWDQKSGPRLFALGGSSTFGWGLDNDETWEHVLQALLRRSPRRGDLSVINGASIGHNSLQVLLRFYLQILPLRPTYALLYENRNDIGRERFEPNSALINEEILFAANFNDYLSQIRPKMNFYARTYTGYLFENKIWPLLHRIVCRRATAGPRPDPTALTNDEQDTIRHNGERYLQNIITLSDICKRRGVTLIIATFIHNDVGFSLFGNASVRHYNDLLRDIAQSEELPLVDLAREFESVPDKESYFFKDHYHPNEKGARYLAEELAEALGPLLEEGSE